MRCLAAGVVLLVVAVGGCSVGEAAPAEVEPLASGAASAGASGEATASVGSRASTSATPRPAPPDAVEKAPSKAPNDEQAASAFTLRFFDVVNEAYARRNAAGIRRLSAPSCGSCAAVADDVDRLARDEHSVAGRRYILSSAEAAPARADGQIVVDFRYDADPYVEQDPSGAIVQRFPADRSRDGQALVGKSSTGDWVVGAIRLVDQ